MGKAIGGAVRFFLVLLVLAVIGYNTYEIGQLRAEVRQLRAARGETRAVGAAGTGAMEQIAEAQSHARKASALVKAKRFEEASKEIKLASEAAGRASGNAQTESRSAIAQMQGTLSKLSGETAALWKQAEDTASTVQKESAKLKRVNQEIETGKSDKNDEKRIP